MQRSGSCVCACRRFTWQLVVLEVVVVVTRTAAKKEATHPESQPLISRAVSHPTSLSVPLPFCLSVCLSVYPQAAGCLYNSYVLCLASVSTFSLESSLGEKGLHYCSHFACGTCGEAEKGGRK